jgi:iron complex outermembrane receptor protein
VRENDSGGKRMERGLRIFMSCLLSLLLIITSIALAEEKEETEKGKKEETKIEEIVVTGEKIIMPTKEAAETVYTGVEVTKEGLKLGGEKGSHNVWEAISILPGVMFESPDPANLATQSGVRIRGVSGSLGSMSIEGIPIYGGNPIGSRTYVLDLENFESIAVYKGAVPADLGPGSGTRGGTLQLRPLWASDKFGVSLKQSLGMFDYTKSFIRVDSGKLGPYGTKVSLSYSYTEEDKWRGEGKLGPRNNVNFTLVQPIGNKLGIRLWGNFNEIKQHKLRSLTYEQADNLNEYRRYDYTKNLTGDPSIDWQYYKFNTLEWTNYDLYAFIDYKLAENFKLTLKPYFRQEEKNDWAGSGSISGPKGSKPGLQNSGWTSQRWGTMGEISSDFEYLKGLLGLQYEESKSIDSFAKNYWLNSDGSLQFVGWGRYTESKGPGSRYSPYAKLSGTVGKFNWQVGLKYLETKESESEGYVTKFDSENNPYIARESKMDYGGRKYTVWLPTAGLSYSINENLEAYTSLGRTFQQPYAYMPLINMYYALFDKFTKMGMTLEDLFKEYKPEKTDNLDIGLRFRNNFVELYPTFFLSRHKNLNTTITPGWKDPDDPSQPLLYQGKPASYSTFVGKANGYGFELGSNFILSDNLTIFLNPTYTKLTYDGDIVSGGTKYDTDGKQVVDIPELSLATGVIAKYKGIEGGPILRYIGRRYGDIAHDEKIPSYIVVDFKLGYNIGKFHILKDLIFSLEAYNLFDKKYIVSTSYYPGAPFTVLGSLSFRI